MCAKWVSWFGSKSVILNVKLFFDPTFLVLFFILSKEVKRYSVKQLAIKNVMLILC